MHKKLRDVKSVNPQVVVKTVRDEHKKQKEAVEKEQNTDEDIEIPDEAESWRSTLDLKWWTCEAFINSDQLTQFEALNDFVLKHALDASGRRHYW